MKLEFVITPWPSIAHYTSSKKIISDNWIYQKGSFSSFLLKVLIGTNKEEVFSNSERKREYIVLFEYPNGDNYVHGNSLFEQHILLGILLLY